MATAGSTSPCPAAMTLDRCRASISLGAWARIASQRALASARLPAWNAVTAAANLALSPDDVAGVSGCCASATAVNIRGEQIRIDQGRRQAFFMTLPDRPIKLFEMAREARAVEQGPGPAILSEFRLELHQGCRIAREPERDLAILVEAGRAPFRQADRLQHAGGDPS